MSLSDPFWVFILAGLGALQVVLNIWFGRRLFILTDNTTKIASSITARLDTVTLARLDAIQAKIQELENAVASRLDANITLLEKIIDHRR